MKQRFIELLSPAKNIEIAKEAILHGADAVYIGGPAFGARYQANNELKDLEELTRFAHQFHAKVFITLNTILHDDELMMAEKQIKSLYELGADALIIQDMGILKLDIPPIDLHASTQCDIRTPEKARFLAECGLSQLVLARELSLPEIRAITHNMPDDIVLEYFVHGALCVAFSGLCNISHAHTGRSANRGDCSQACRLPYTLTDEKGGVIAFEKHLLSMKDNNQTTQLRALIDAGIRSFKIEGRYKDMAYVKNTTAHYRRVLDEILNERPELCASSSGVSHCFFTPNLEKTFHRGNTDYFTTGRKQDIGAFETPKFVGILLGEVQRLGKDFFEVESGETLQNGDGLNFQFKREQIGIQVNAVQHISANLWRVFPNESLESLKQKGLKIGVNIWRNRDQAWEKMLQKQSATRKIGIHMQLENDERAGLTLILKDEDHICASAHLPAEFVAPQTPEQTRERIQKQLCKLGESYFYLIDFKDKTSKTYFLPSAFWNRLRREALDALMYARLHAHPRAHRRPEISPPPLYPLKQLDFLSNVYNELAKRFYFEHGVEMIAPAFEAHQETGEVSLMVTKHCLRFSFNLCPKQAKGVQGVMGQIRADPLILRSGKEEFTLKFECRPCEMHVMGKIKKHILKTPPPNLFPVRFLKKEVSK